MRNIAQQNNENVCGASSSHCNQIEGYCTTNDQCVKWEREARGLDDGEDGPSLLYFIPQVTIPGSGLFNAGEPVVITGKTLGEYIVALYVFFVSVAGILATVMMMYGGFKYVTSMGSQQKTTEGKDIIVSSLLGLAITLGSYIILLFINPNLVKFDGLTLVQSYPISQYERSEGTLRSPGFWDGKSIKNFDKCLTAEAQSQGIDRNWLKSIMLIESGGRPTVISPAGAVGLLQLMPATAAVYESGVTVTDLQNAAINIRIAARHYKDLLQDTCPLRSRYKSGRKVSCDPNATKCKPGDHHYAVAAYNGGVGSNCSSITCPGQTWWECTGNPGYAETRAYVIKVESVHENIVRSEKDPSGYPEFAWHDTDTDVPTCAELLAGLPAAGGPPACPSVAITSATAINATESVQTAYTVAGDGGADSYTVTNCPALITIDNFNGTTGQLQFTPNAGAAAASPITCTISAANACGNSSGPTNLVVTVAGAVAPDPACPGKYLTGGPPIIYSYRMRHIELGVAYSYTIQATDNPTGYAQNGPLPPGLSYTAGSHTIEGTPNTSGQWDSTISATNPDGTNTEILALRVSGSAQMTSNRFELGTVGAAYNYLIDAPGITTVGNISAASLPPGLFWDSFQIISGNPTLEGIFSTQVLPCSPSCMTWNRVIFTIGNLDKVASVGNNFSMPTPKNSMYSTYLFCASNLPPGLNINYIDGTISGVPTTAGVYNVIYTIHWYRGNSSPSDHNFTITVNP